MGNGGDVSKMRISFKWGRKTLLYFPFGI